MPTRRRKRKKKAADYDYDSIADETRGQVKESSERKGMSSAGIFKSDIKATFYKPTADEDHTIDIVPFKAGDKMPVDMRTRKPMVRKGRWAYTYEYWAHRGIGPLENETVICPQRTYGKPCPICEHRKELIAEKTFDAKKMGELLCKQRNLYNVVCYDTDKEEDKGVQLFDVSNFYFEKHISKLATKTVRRKKGRRLAKADPFKNFADPRESGVYIEWSIEGAKSKNDFDSWIGHQLIERDYSLDEEYLENALQLDQIVEVLDYKELYKLYYDEDYEDDDDDVSYVGEDEEDYGEEKEEEEELEEEEEEKPKRRRRKKINTRRRKKNVSECPAGGVFGDDFDEFDDCDNCEIWDACDEKANEEEEEED